MNKILIIEDSPLSQSLLSEILHNDYKLVFKNDGLTGLDSAQTSFPDLILLDIRMPVMDGYDVCRTLKGNDKTRDIPIIFITSLDSEAETVRGFEAGADDYVVKPFLQQELRARIKTHLSLRKAKLQAVNLERLTVFKEMAVALSHEINNPLMAIFAFLHYLRDELTEATPAVKTALNGIKTESMRIQQITGKLANAKKADKVRYNRDIDMIDLHNL